MTWAIALMVAIGGLSVMLAGGASAAPLGLANSAIAQSIVQDSDLTLVRDGCGRGMRYSNRRQACVPDFDRGPPVVVVPRFVEPPVRFVPRGCPPGSRWSNSRGRCVSMY